VVKYLKIMESQGLEMTGCTEEDCEAQDNRASWLAPKGRRRWRPPTDVYETDTDIVIKVEIAGMKTQDFTISFVDRRLSISGCRNDVSDKISYQNMEIPYGEFHTEVRINWPLKQDEISAVYEDGFLLVKLPKHSREYKIPVKQTRAPSS